MNLLWLKILIAVTGGALLWYGVIGSRKSAPSRVRSKTDDEQT